MDEDRIRMFTMRDVMTEDEDSQVSKKLYIVPSKVHSNIWKKREQFDTYFASNLRLTKFIHACKVGQIERATQMVREINPSNRTPTKKFLPPGSVSRRERKPHKNIAMGGFRPSSPGPGVTDKPRLWRTGSVILDNTLEQQRDFLLIACRYNRPSIAQLLIDGNASVYGTGNSPYTPIYTASLFGSTNVVNSVLVPNKPEVCETDSNGCTPLHLLVLSGDVSCVEKVLELGADLLAEDCLGRLPVYYAYLIRDRVMCQYLWFSMSYLADAITDLDLSRCEMNFFPPDSVMGRFTHLETLNVSDNKLYYLAPSLGKLDSLTELNVSGNPLKALPHGFVNLSVPEMKTHLKTLKESEESWARRRIVVLGCGGVGKSSLIRSLGISSSILSRKGLKTLFVKPSEKLPLTELMESSGFIVKPFSQELDCVSFSEVTKISNASEGVNSSSCIFWEIADKEELYSHYFLKGDVIHIIVYNLEELELKDIDALLDKIKSVRNVDSSTPIFLVGTHADNPLCSNEHIEVVLETLRERYPIGRFKGLLRDNFFAVNATSSKSVDNLREVLAKMISNPIHADKLFPRLDNSSWLIFRELIHNQEIKYMSKEDILHALHACAIPQEQLIPCLDFLQSCDNVLSFDLITKGRHLLILDLTWWTETIQAIISPKNPFQKNGLLSIDDLNKHLYDISSYVLEDILYVLEEDHIVFRFRGQIIIPSLLQTSKPPAVNENWPILVPVGMYECQRIYKYSQGAKHLFSCLQQELLHVPNVSNFILWESGLFLTSNNQNILINHSVIKQFFQIHICIRYHQEGAGSNAGMMLVVCEILEALIRSNYNYLLYNITRLIPCVHCLGMRVLTGELFLFEYDECYRAVTEGNPFVFCNHIESPSRCVRVDKLAPDLAFADIKQIEAEQFTTGKLLGRGGFGCVYHGLLEGQHEIAIKELIISEQCSQEEKVASFGEFLREAYIMSFLEHPNLVSLYGVCVNPPRLLMEYVPCGDLQHLIMERSKESKPLEEWLIIKIATDVAIGMNHLHSISPPVIHRDLRSPNIFLVSLEKDAKIVAKIADFGLSRMKASKQIQESLSTYQWMAPETLGTSGKKVEYDEKADVYSYGIILWELLTLGFPFDEYLNESKYTYTNPLGKTVFNTDAVKEAIEFKKLRPTIPESTPELLKEIIRKCWSHRPSNRPSFYDIMELLVPGKDIEETKMHIDPIRSSIHHTKTKKGTPKLKNSISCVQSITLHSDVDQVPSRILAIKYRLWIGCHNGAVRVFDISCPSKAKFVASWQAHVNSIYCMIHCTPIRSGVPCDEIWLGGTDGMISIYPINASGQRNLKRKWSVDRIKKTSKDGKDNFSETRILSLAHVKLEDKNVVWCGELNNIITVWNESTFEIEGTIYLPENCSTFDMIQHSNGQVWVGSTEKMFVYNPKTLELQQQFTVHPGGQVLSMVPVKDTIWSAGSDGKICIWRDDYALVMKLTAHKSKIFCMCIDEDGNVWSGSFDTTIIVWDTIQYKPIEEIAHHTDSVRSITSQDGTIWSVGMDNVLRTWNINKINK